MRKFGHLFLYHELSGTLRSGEGIAYDASLSRRRLRGTSNVAACASEILLTTRIMQHSDSTFKKFAVRQPNGSTVELRQMFEFLANQPPIQHHHIAREEIINGSDGPAIPGFQDAIGFVFRPLFNNGNILQYLAVRPRRWSEKLKLVAEVASALSYLHFQGIIHGNVSPTNILVSDDGRAMLVDVGIYATVVNFVFVPCGHIPVPPTARYKSPEEAGSLEDTVPPQTTDKDVYSLASSTYEIMSGQTPFGSMRLYSCIIEIARNGHLRLPQPEGITGGLWQLLRACWSINPKDRPEIEDVQARLETLLIEDI